MKVIYLLKLIFINCACWGLATVAPEYLEIATNLKPFFQDASYLSGIALSATTLYFMLKNKGKRK